MNSSITFLLFAFLQVQIYSRRHYSDHIACEEEHHHIHWLYKHRLVGEVIRYLKRLLVQQ
jgi:hypothetical protein